jgi:hypothetical protein
MYLDRLFKLMADKQASDLYITCGAPINIKVNGIVQPVSSQTMDVETVRRIAYDLMTKEQAREFENEREMNMSHLDRTVGLSNVKVWHCNDAKAARGSKLDRHDLIGKGTIGTETFGRLLNDYRFKHAAFIAETPIEEPGDDQRNVDALKSLVLAPGQRASSKRA